MQFANDLCEHKSIDELIGICRGIVADGNVCVQEAKFLQAWLAKNGGRRKNHLLSNLTKKIDEVLSDDILDTEEAKDLLSILKKVDETGEAFLEVEKSGNWFIDDSCKLDFLGKIFVLTGLFSAGSRKFVEDEIVKAGGILKKNVTRQTNYLVIGEYANPDWSSTDLGNKIKYAIELKEKDYAINIISENKLMNGLLPSLHKIVPFIDTPDEDIITNHPINTKEQFFTPDEYQLTRSEPISFSQGVKPVAKNFINRVIVTSEWIASIFLFFASFSIMSDTLLFGFLFLLVSFFCCPWVKKKLYRLKEKNVKAKPLFWLLFPLSLFLKESLVLKSKNT